MKSRNVRGSKSSICPMSLEKRFKILPGRRGYEKLLISPDRSFRRNNSQINQNNILNAYAFNTLHIRMMSVVKGKERGLTPNKKTKTLPSGSGQGAIGPWFVEDWRKAASAILPRGAGARAGSTGCAHVRPGATGGCHARPGRAMTSWAPISLSQA